LSEPGYFEFFDATPSGGATTKSASRTKVSGPSKVRFHDEVKVKTIKPRGKGLPVSTMRLLDDAPSEDDEEDDSEEVESEDEDEGDEQGITRGYLANENSGAEFSSDEQGSQLDDDGSEEGKFSFSDGHQTIKRLKDDMLADEDEPNNGIFGFRRHTTYLWLSTRVIHS
jgi:U3 small nucleolar RNA-associated protein MPP10